jgi:cytochrome c peroxidase
VSGMNRCRSVGLAALAMFVAAWQFGCGGAGGNVSSPAQSSATTNSAPIAPTPTTLVANLQPFTDSTGSAATFSSTGSVDTTGVFFQQLGTNGRTCATCHQLSQGLSISAASTLALFNSTNGADPLFAAVDGANCPSAAAGDAAGRSLMLNKALVRIPITPPANAEFTISVLHDPYGCAISTAGTNGQQTVSVYRRPLPAASLVYMSQIMWDARQTASPLNAAGTFAANLDLDLASQAASAVAGHMQATAAPTTDQTNAILALEKGFFTAQEIDSQAGSLSANGATGGATNLAAQGYHPGINDAFGQDPQNAPFNSAIFRIYQAWNNSANPQQASIARGQGIFNSAPLTITDVRGINDNPALGSPAALVGTCGTCHDTPNVGNHSLPLPLDIGTSRLAANETSADIIAGLGKLAAADVPVYQISGCRDANGNAILYITTDPGVGLFTGLCADVNRLKVPALRGLAARAPYFHNGSADNLNQLVNFYDNRFRMHLNQQQRADLVNFLSAL